MKFNSALALLGFTFSAVVSAQPMKIVDLTPQGVFPAPEGSPLVASYATGISDGNLVVGWADFINDPPPAFQTQRPFITCEGCPAFFFDIPGPHGFATAISNNSEYVVGSIGLYFNPWTPGLPYQRAFILRNGEAEWLPVTEGWDTAIVTRHAVAYGVNDYGLAVGQSERRLPVLWEDDLVSVLPNSGSESRGTAYDINNSTQIVGDLAASFSEPSQAVLWYDGNHYELGNLPGHDASGALAVNEHGQIAGWSGVSEADSTRIEWKQAVLWDNGMIQNLGTLPGAESSYAAALNDYGQVVGSSGDRAFLWQCEQMIDLTALVIPRNTGWELTEAWDINNEGYIVGVGLKDGAERAYMLKPLGHGPRDCRGRTSGPARR